MKYKLYYIQLIDTEEMETVEISRMALSPGYLIGEIEAVAKCYNSHGYNLDKARIFNTDRELLVSYDL